MKGKGLLIDDSFQLKVEVARDADGKIISGMQIGNTLYQNQGLILVFHPGSVKTAPAVGVGISDFLLSNDFLEFRRRIRQQLELDGQKVRNLTFSTTQQLEIDADYNG